MDAAYKALFVMLIPTTYSPLIYAVPTLVLDTNHSPPASIPADADRIYSVSLGHIISKGVIARLDDGTGTTITDTAGLTFTVTSIDATGASPDTFATGGANLCQYANRREYPNTYEGRDYKYKFYCNTTNPSMVISDIPLHDGKLTADGLYHVHTTLPPNNRKFVLSMDYQGTPLSVTTNAFEITTPAAKMGITVWPSSGTIANTDFDITVEIQDSAGVKVATGIDATLPVMLQVAWFEDLQLFNGKAPLEDMLFQTMERLSGTGAKLSRSTYQMYIDKRAVAGEVTFTGVRLLDVHTCVKLNLTMRMPNYPHSRMPNTYNDFTMNKVFFDLYASDATKSKILFYMNGTSDGAVFLTDCIPVTEQTATGLQIVTPTNDINLKIGANFPIESYLVIQVVDAGGERVYSGSDSTLNITTTADVSVCLSDDLQTIPMSEGTATVVGSICEAHAAVTLSFDATSAVSSTALTQVQIGPVEVTNEIHLAAYYSTYDSGSSSQTGAFSDSFAQYAVEDINAGVMYPSILPGRQLTMHSYNTKNSPVVSTTAFMEMLDNSKKNPHERVRGIVGFGSNTVTKGLSSLLNLYQMPNIATNEDEFSFSEKSSYPYYNRLSWNMGSLSHSVMMSCRNRGWKYMSIIRTVDFTIDTIFFEKAKQFGITILAEVAIPKVWGATYTANAFNSSLEKIKDAGSRIVWMFVMPPVSYYFMREAIDKGMGGIDGWQWNMLGLFGWAFPWANQGPTCMGILAEYSLAYDAVQMFGIAMSKLINESMTITGPRLTTEIRNVYMEKSLTGELQLNANGDRPGYIGVIVNVNPHPFSWPDHINAFPPSTAMFTRMIFMESDTATSQREYSMQAKRPMDLIYGMEIANYTIAYTKYTNLRLFNGSHGRIGTWSLKLEQLPSANGTAITEEIIEKSVAPFYCTGGCGGNKTDDFDITLYQFGHCSHFNVCKCDEGYYGLSCQHMTCNCVNGQCYIPNTCVCENGWTGVRCEVPICGFDCGDGVCSGPDTCECNSGSVGSQCNQSIYVVTIIPILCFIIFIILLIFLIRWLLKRYHLQQALKNLDWLVKWDEVVVGDTRAMSIMSTAGDDFATSAKSNMCTWRSQKCYVQKFNCDTLSVEDENLRMEVVTIRELRHNNLVQFVGACLEYPNVCVLTEVTPKGSLEDLLSNDNVKLGWDFKFSLLKDICRGMHFLHLSEIHSHGRLKTSNCLVDNRWTCKISGFGLPSLRYNGPRKKLPDDDENEKKLNSLFWTAPEMLPGCKNIDGVKQGTKHGDVYSFGIILSEVCTREEPYSTETGFLEPEQILQLVIDKDAPGASGAKKLWYKSGGDTTKLFRPAVKNEHLPEEYAAKTGLQKLMGQCWGNQPELRPSFKNVNEKLNEIYPIKGELIDNLVNMLEKYSSNLEQIVADRTKELVEEKRKTEQLISQMLPKKVVEDLKHGNPVEPESFECVTIFFSDIVGFTNIAKGSTPFQVVDLLNDLYTTFDAILDNYDVYKVETIGDAYMIVSGLPIRNGDLHAGEIATCSLDLMASMVGFKIRHMPGTVLQLRVGMHSGPCVAGVVGLKMPRYCLFGDTVNTASRMESSSMALRIHMSDATAQILIRLGGYHLECRGEREVKGKGVMTTWWIDGKDGFDKELPGKDMAASLSQHEFK
ncbi:uncharacterized protein LOC127720912 [Mytilus californianus]|uniref:uncharacterized protein LOC127720912 n=1 Tax=Mytilus californianus TaxID=6549 RepID=UPI002245D50F|nr:uncharacterized protein LOC127720912 [Mytilus californianus]